MSQLNPGARALLLEEPCNAGQGLDMFISPDAHVGGRDSSLACDRRRFDKDQPDSTGCPAAQMHEVPIIGQPVDRAVLAHGRHDDPVAQYDVPNRQRTKQIDLGHFAVMIRTGRASMRRTDSG
jgi:hypothetical protein